MKKTSTLLADFIKYLKNEKRRSPKTIANYNFYLSRFINFFGNKNPAKITVASVNQYQKWLKKLIDAHGEPLRENTQNYHLIALRSFLKFLRRKNINILNPKKIILTKALNKKMPLPNSRELNVLLEAPLNLKAGPKKLAASIIASRDKAILEFLLSTGLIVSEISNLKIKDINIKKNLIMLRAKKNKKREVILSHGALYWLKKYLLERKDKNPFLFIPHDKRTLIPKIKSGNDNKPLTPRSIQRSVQKYARMSGIAKTVTPHTLRHCYALYLLANESNLEKVKNKLGWSAGYEHKST